MSDAMPEKCPRELPEDGACSHADIVIVGGGMVGLSLAIMLAKRALAKRIVLIEAKPSDAHMQRHSPNFDERSTALSAGTIDTFEALGLWPQLAEVSAAIKHVKVSDQGHFGYTGYQGGEAVGAVIENTHLLRALSQELQGYTSVELQSNTRVKRISPVVLGQASGMSLVCECEQQAFELSTDLLVLADGALSQHAASLGIHFDKYNYDQRAVIANIAHSQPHQGQAFECFLKSGPLAMLPLPDFQGQHRSALVWTHSSDDFEAVLALDDSDFLAQLQGQFGYRLGRLTAVGQRSAYPLNLYSAKEQVRRSLVLIGNAAHLLHPVAGQGFNLSIRDCVALCDQLAQSAKAKRQLGDLYDLQTYQDARQQDQWLTTQLSHSFITWFASDSLAKAALRNAGLLALNGLPALHQGFFKHMMGKGAHRGRLL